MVIIAFIIYYVQTLSKSSQALSHLVLPVEYVLVVSSLYDSETEAHSHQRVRPRLQRGHWRFSSLDKL